MLQERKVSAHAPTVTITAPTASDSLTGTVTIKWTASDQDGDPLNYDVEYSDDGENWITLATDITNTQWTEDFSVLPGTGTPAANTPPAANTTDTTSATPMPGSSDIPVAATPPAANATDTTSATPTP